MLRARVAAFWLILTQDEDVAKVHVSGVIKNNIRNAGSRPLRRRQDPPTIPYLAWYLSTTTRNVRRIGPQE